MAKNPIIKGRADPAPQVPSDFEPDSCPLVQEMTSPEMREASQTEEIRRWSSLGSLVGPKPDLNQIKEEVTKRLADEGINLRIIDRAALPGISTFKLSMPFGVTIGQYERLTIEDRTTLQIKKPEVKEAALFIARGLSSAEYECALYKGLISADMELQKRAAEPDLFRLGHKLGLNAEEQSFVCELLRDFSLHVYAASNGFNTAINQAELFRLTRIVSQFLGPEGEEFNHQAAAKALAYPEMSPTYEEDAEEVSDLKIRGKEWHEKLISGLHSYCEKVCPNIAIIMHKLSSDAVRWIDLQSQGLLKLWLDKQLAKPAEGS